MADRPEPDLLAFAQDVMRHRHLASPAVILQFAKRHAVVSSDGYREYLHPSLEWDFAPSCEERARDAITRGEEEK